MLRTHRSVRSLTVADHDEALALCGQDPAVNVFVAARIVEGCLRTQPGTLIGYDAAGSLSALCWASANVVPVGCGSEALGAFAQRLRKCPRGCSSLFGSASQVMPLWNLLSDSWGIPRAIRADQPMLTTATPPSNLGVASDPLVRPARANEVDLIAPAAAAMFTEEIGYPPYGSSDAAYRRSVEALIRRGHTFVRIEKGEVVFKADVGSVAPGAAQIQGVWVAPRWRGRGLAVPAMAAVVETILASIAPVAALYVNAYNAPARAAYQHVGFMQADRFATVLL